MDFDRLEEFFVIAQTRSIKKAAEELGLSSATLSARLLRFEEHLGTKLFTRTATAMELTPSGQQLLLRASEILRQYKKLKQDMRSAQEHSYHQLRIAVCGSNLPLYLGPFLDRLNLAYPQMQLEILDDTQFGIADGIQSGNVDIYFAPVMSDFAPKGLSKNPIASPSQYVILPRSHPKANSTILSIRELDGEQFLLYPKSAEPAIRNFQLRNLSGSGIRYTTYDSCTSVLFYKLLVPVGKGILLRPTPMMDIPPNTVCIPVTDLPCPATTCFFYSKANPSADVLAFAKDFPAFAKELVSHEHRQTL